MGTKNAATEEEIGILHGLITKCHNRKGQAMLDLVDRLVEEGESAEFIIDAVVSRDLSVMQKWVEYNKVGCNTAEDDKTSELSKRLKKLKDEQSGKVVAFKDPKEA